MSDLISRDAAINAVGESLADGKGWYTALVNVPSAEKTGMWIPIISHTKEGREKIQWGCSECGQSMYQFGQRFCSGCGARMEVE